MNSKAWVAIVLILAIIIAVLAWLLFTTPVQTAPATTSAQATTTSPAKTASPTQPLVTTVTTPAANSTVSHSFEVAGSAPNTWFFEAVFPIQVRDANDDLIGSSQAQAQGDWTQQGLVTFTSKVTVDSSYEGPASLIILKDNPSGDPENIDSVIVPITIR